jgi:membrane protease YdiL (CAAX protease family)
MCNKPVLKIRLSFREWAVFILVALSGFGLWYKFGYPQFSFVDLSCDKRQAVEKAQNYLEAYGVKTEGYLRSVIFRSDDLADTYLQKTLGQQGQKGFISQQGYEFFSWRVRFFKEFQKEEYLLDISPKSGKILSFRHLIEDIEPRLTLPKEIAKKKAEEFLTAVCRIDFADYDFHEEKVTRFDNRTDYSFSWEKKGVFVPWKKGLGGAKLLSGVTVSAEEMREFYLGGLDVPEHFRRYVEKQFIFGELVSNFSQLLFIVLVVLSIILVLRVRQSVILKICQRWYLGLALFLGALNAMAVFNNIQPILNNYFTSASLSSYIGVYVLSTLMSVLFISVTFTLPGLAGESLLEEDLSFSRPRAFAPFLRSTFLGRSMASSVFLGYILFVIMLGFQAVIFYFGQKYLGVWKQWFNLTQFSSAYIPFFSAFVIGVTASLTEEVVFRAFGIAWLKKYLKSAILAVILSALIWGFGHTRYAIFPIWFRGLEVSLLGVFLGSMFIRYGLIPLIVAHYLFDVFWGVAAYILGTSTPYLFISALVLLSLPMGFGVLAFFINRPEKEEKIELTLSATQEYNLEILVAFVFQKKSQAADLPGLKKELIEHGWDKVLVDLAIRKVFGDA